MAATPRFQVLAAIVEQGLVIREYRDHRLEWTLRSGGTQIALDGLAEEDHPLLGRVRLNRRLTHAAPRTQAGRAIVRRSGRTQGPANLSRVGSAWETRLRASPVM